MKIKRFVLICVCLCVAFLFFSCNKNTTDLSDFEQITFDNEKSATPFADIVYLTVPDSSSGELVSRAEGLAKNITAQTGVGAIVKYDSQPVSLGSESLRILLGNTSDIISAEALKGFRKDDYICRYERGAIVIGGVSETATIAAIDRFEKDILPSSSNGFFMSEDAHFENFGEYELNSLVVNGFNIYEFTIAYGTVGVQSDIASVLGEYISSKSGYVLNVKGYGELDGSAAKIIYLHLDAEIDKNTAIIERKDNDFEIRASDSYALSGAVANFVSMIFPEDVGADISVTVDTCTPMKYYPDGASFSLLAQKYENGRAAEFLLALSGALRNFEGDMLCLLGAGEDITEDIKCSIPSGYGALPRESYWLICESDRANGASLKLQDGVKTIQFLSDTDQIWTVYIADSFDGQIGNVGARSIIFLKEDISDTSDIVKIGEITVGSGNEKYFVYTPRALDSSLSIESFRGEQNDFYMVCCSVKVDMKYHSDFLALKNTAE